MLSGISVWSLLLILAIVVLLFGTKKIKTLGSDLGEAVRGFRRSVNESEKEDQSPTPGIDPGASGNEKQEESASGSGPTREPRQNS